jgi:hypothetical protein
MEMSVPTSVEKRSRRGRFGLFGGLAAALRRLKLARVGGAYRPEKHYMRGAGPKSRKDGRGPITASDARDA